MIELSSQQAQDFAEPMAVSGGNITANYAQSRNKSTFNLPFVCLCVCFLKKSYLFFLI
jgi:hypothetical protein